MGERARSLAGTVVAVLTGAYLFWYYFLPKLTAVFYTFYTLNGNSQDYTTRALSVLLIFFSYLLLYVLIVLSIKYLFYLRPPGDRLNLSGSGILSFLMLLLFVFTVYYLTVFPSSMDLSLLFLSVLVLVYAVVRYLAGNPASPDAPAPSPSGPVRSPEVEPGVPIGRGPRGPGPNPRSSLPRESSGQNNNIYNTADSRGSDESLEKVDDFSWYL
ncbi:MAG: hypothetical protein ACP5KL_05935 [Thermoplasmata archaeon]